MAQKGFLLLVVVLLAVAFFASMYNDATGQAFRSSRTDRLLNMITQQPSSEDTSSSAITIVYPDPGATLSGSFEVAVLDNEGRFFKDMSIGLDYVLKDMNGKEYTVGVTPHYSTIGIFRSELNSKQVPNGDYSLVAKASGQTTSGASYPPNLFSGDNTHV